MPISFRFAYSAAAAAVAVLMTACGGSGGGSQNFTGKVIDGYIGGATVCLDVNSNMSCDADEPFDTTDSQGNYSFEYAGSTAGMHVLAVVPKGAIDSELGAIEKPFNLLTPAEKPKAVTPLTTLVSSEMINSKGSAEEAQAVVKANLNLSKDVDVLDYDFKEVGDKDTLAVAQVAATALALAQEAIETSEDAAGLSKADVVKAAVEQVSQRVLPAVISSDGKLALDLGNAQSQTELEAALKANDVDVKTTVSGSIQQIVARSKAGDGEVVDMAQYFKDGFLSVEVRGSNLDDPESDQPGQYFESVLQAQYIQYEKGVSDTNTLGGWEYILHPDKTVSSGVTWGKRHQWTDRVYQFDGTKWVIGSDNNYIVGFQDNCVELERTPNSAVREKVCSVKRDLSGKLISDFIPGLCEADDGSIEAGCDVTAKFPAGAEGADLTFTQTADNYQVWASNDWGGYAPTVDQFLSEMVEQGRWHYTGDACNTRFQVTKLNRNASDEIVGGEVSWAPNAGGCDDAELNDFTETTQFVTKQVGDKTIVQANAPNVYRQKNPGDRAPYLIFVEVENVNGVTGVFNGDMTPANTKMTIPFTGDPESSMQVLTPEAFDAILSAEGLPAYPYPQQ